MAAYDEMSDSELVALLKEGDEHALRMIYRKYWKLLYNECCRRLNDPAQNEELVQDILANLWEKRAEREIENLEAYLTTAAKYAVYRQYRRNQSLPFFEEPLEHMVYEESEADSALFLKELRVFIDQWLEAQPEKRREIFRRRYFEDQTTEEISQQMAVPQKTVQNTLRNTMVALRADIAKFLVLMPFFMDHHK
ncbi:RNA polymerase sigma factor [Mucilaginibacter sp.]|jgi:RNA polymerase sigma-70 factor (ECF subfamily)|uniref:RNA polymerase sigma factor n=1 Tax=Mucilaginibacter sp. TaxID=1882438 RepID=UPI00356A7019